MIGEKIRSLREKKGFTQEEIAEHLHISPSAYARMERGESNSWASHLERLCSLFDISVSELFNTDHVVFNHKAKGDYAQNNAVNNGYIINQLSEKLIDQYEARIAEKNAIISEQKEQINELKEQLKKEVK